MIVVVQNQQEREVVRLPSVVPGNQYHGAPVDAVFVSHRVDTETEWFKKHIRSLLNPGGRIYRFDPYDHA